MCLRHNGFYILIILFRKMKYDLKVSLIVKICFNYLLSTSEVIKVHERNVKEKLHSSRIIKQAHHSFFKSPAIQIHSPLLTTWIVISYGMGGEVHVNHFYIQLPTMFSIFYLLLQLSIRFISNRPLESRCSDPSSHQSPKYCQFI